MIIIYVFYIIIFITMTFFTWKWYSKRDTCLKCNGVGYIPKNIK